MVAAESHLWLNLTEIREERIFLMDAPISQSGLFGEAVSSVVDKFHTAKSQSAALKQFMPRRAREPSNRTYVPRDRFVLRREPVSRSDDLVRPPPFTVWGARIRK